MSEYQTYRSDGEQKPSKRKGQGLRLRPIYKRIKFDKLYLLAKEYISKQKEKKIDFVFAEKIAKHFQVKKHEIKEVFKKLNQEGILSQACRNNPPHDCDRELGPFGCIGWGHSGWIATQYKIL
jgi:hypothetical protein